MNQFDFHIHSNYSDGDLAPCELYRKLMASNVLICSITDHNNLEFYDNCTCFVNSHIKLVTGIELSACTEFSKEEHILGYNIDIHNKNLRAYCDDVKSSIYKVLLKCYRILKKNRIIDSIEILNNRMSYNRLSDYLLKNNLLNNLKTLEDIYLQYSDLFDFPFYINYEEAIKLIKEAGGYAFLAHPFRNISDNEFCEQIMNQYVVQKLDGIECYHPSNNLAEIESLRRYCIKNNLLISGGSDFHEMDSNENDAVYYDDSLKKQYIHDLSKTIKCILKDK